VCDSHWGQGFILFATTSRPGLGPTQPPIQWVLGALSSGVKQLEHEADHTPLSSAKVKVWCLVKYRIHLHGMMLRVEFRAMSFSPPHGHLPFDGDKV